MINIIHITAHLGGGAGKILSNVALHSKIEREIKHSIITLEPTQSSHFEKICKEQNIEVYLATQCDLLGILERADIVQMDWWHHPLMTEFMVKYLDKIKCRLLIWSHISGCGYPYIPAKFVNFADKFVFASRFSYENPNWSIEERTQIMHDTRVIVSSGIDVNEPVKKKIHKHFNVGYVGFLSYNKTHPKFVEYCESACDIPNIKFTIVGDINYAQELIRDVQQSEKVKDKIIFTGYSLNVLEDLSEMDVFGYPLAPTHTGTAENALLEAMAAGIVPVVLNQCTEKHIVHHMKTGLIVNNIIEYGNALRWLNENVSIRNKLGKNASEFVIREYNIKSTVEKLDKLYRELLDEEKTFHYAREVFGITPYEWFLTCYAGDINYIEGNAFSETKASIKQYLKYFNEDESLRKVVEKNESRIKAKL